MTRNSEKPKQVYLQLTPNYDIIAVSETWLDHNVHNNNFNIAGYHPLFRRDRPGPGQGGGVATWVSSDLVAKRRLDLELNDVEAIWLEIRSNNNKFLLCTVYGPPNSGIVFWDNMQLMLDSVKISDIKHTVILGDLNADDNSPHGPHFQYFIRTNSLVSHINEPTRITCTTQTILDIIVTNIPQHVCDAQVIAPLLMNDHCTISISLTYRIPKPQCYTRLMWDYSRADFDGLNNHISRMDWDEICGDYTNIDIAADNWTSAIMEAMKQFIPNKLVVVRSRDKPWYTSDLRRQRRVLERCHRRAKKRNEAVNWTNYRKARNSYIQHCRDRESEYDNSQIEKLSQSDFTSKTCWKLYKSI